MPRIFAISKSLWCLLALLIFSACHDADPSVGLTLRHALDAPELQLPALPAEKLRFLNVGLDLVVQSQAAIPFSLRASHLNSDLTLQGPTRAELKIQPKLSFLRPGRVVHRQQSLVYSDGDAALVRTFSECGLQESLVVGTFRGNSFRYGWQLELEGGLEVVALENGGAELRGAKGEALYRVSPPVIRDWHRVEHPELSSLEIGENGRLRFHFRSLEGLPHPVSMSVELCLLEGAEPEG